MAFIPPEVLWSFREHCSSCIARASPSISEWSWSCTRTSVTSECDRWTLNFPSVNTPFPLFPPPVYQMSTLLLNMLSQCSHCFHIYSKRKKTFDLDLFDVLKAYRNTFLLKNIRNVFEISSKNQLEGEYVLAGDGIECSRLICYVCVQICPTFDQIECILWAPFIEFFQSAGFFWEFVADFFDIYWLLSGKKRNFRLISIECDENAYKWVSPQVMDLNMMFFRWYEQIGDDTVEE